MQTPEDDTDEMTPAEVAREFNVHPDTVRRWEHKGILVPRRLPSTDGHGYRRYSKADVEALKRQQHPEETA